MNNRQRAITAIVLERIRHRKSALGYSPRLYLTEQITPMFHFFDDHVAGIECIGSEYFGFGIPSGTLRDGLRHEDIEAMSFNTGSMDLVVSCAVLEHVNEPLDAIVEVARILKPGGELILDIPFNIHKEHNTRRARLVDGEIEHFLAPEYHGDPMTDEGVLVFTDFGWEFLDQIRQTGLFTCNTLAYWSLTFGHLGGIQLLFHAVRTEKPWSPRARSSV